MKFVFTSEPEQLCEVRERIRRFLEPLPLEETERYLVLMGIDEACSNIIRHAYNNTPGKRIVVELRCRNGEFHCRLRDYGVPADPGEFRVRQMNEGVAGGMGYHLMHRAFDAVDYQPQKRGTELLLKRRLPAAEDRYSMPDYSPAT